MFAVTVVTCLALASLGGARADSETRCETRPTIAATTLTETSFMERSKFYLVSTYGEDVTLFCSADSTDPAIESEGNYLPTTRLNTTTIQLFVEKPCVGQYDYNCVDNGCKDTLIVIVVPAFFVKSPRVHHMKTAVKRDIYFVPRGDVYQMYCSGKELRILEESKTSILQTEVVNQTTVKVEAHANETGVSFYSCESQACNGVGKAQQLRLIVDFYPEAYDFKCISFGLHWRKLECSWTSSSKENSFKLFLVEYLRSHLLCSYGSGATTRVCVADNSIGAGQGLSGTLILQTCNQVFCDNKTYSFGVHSIVKLNAPSELRLLNRTSKSVTLKWFSKFAWWESVFKVEYRLLGSLWRQVNTSAVKIPPFSDYCEFQVSLPCPDAHYEVRVYVKNIKALEERFWSDPTPSLYFFTDPSSEAEDPECNAALQEPEPITSVETGLNEIGKLIRETTKERKALKAFVSDMQVKLAKIRALRDL